LSLYGTISDRLSSSIDSLVLSGEESKPEDGGLVLVVEDDFLIAEDIRLELQASGHAVQVAASVTEGLRAARSGNASALVIDRTLHGEDGLSIIETLRGEGRSTPALIISGLASVEERIAGLKAGCDDYLVKPFDIRELTARVEALLRRSGRTGMAGHTGVAGDMGVVRLRVGDLEMDLIERTVRREGELVDLVPKEFKLLEYFMRRPGQTVTRAMLLEDVWNFESPTYSNIVDVQVGNLRRKLDPTDVRRFIGNVRSVGFKLNVDD
jgi:two-component system, OmpR family, response regulator